MLNFFKTYQQELLITFIALILLFIFQSLLKSFTTKAGNKASINVARIHLVMRYINALFIMVAVFIIAMVWGANVNQIVLIFSSVFTVIGIGLFAIWSILSNVTSGVIMFFSFPYKIGDKIKIHDKDFPIEAIIEDIKAFQLHLRTTEGELITYPNNLMLQKPVSLVEKDAVMDDGASNL